MSEEKESLNIPTKSFFLAQIEFATKGILRNEGIINFCRNMIEKGYFVEEEKAPPEKED